MAVLSDIFNLGGSGLAAYQNQINVAGNNIANVNTKGYSRRTVNLETSNSYTGLGTGVLAGDVTRVYNSMGRYALLQEQSSYSYHSELATALGRLELTAGSGNQGMDLAMSNFQNALQDAISSPNDLTARTTLLQRAATLTSEINGIDSTITAALGNEESILGNPDTVVEEINAITTQLEDINFSITKANIAGRPIPDLLDQRDRLVRELSEKVNITVSPDYQISFGGQELVGATGQSRSDLVFDGAGNTFSVGGVDVSAAVQGGKLASVVAAHQTAEILQQQINTLASTLIVQTNAIFETGYNLQGERPVDQGYSFFTGTDASDIAMDTALYNASNPLDTHPELVALASTPNSGDNSVGHMMYELLQSPQTSLGNSSISGYWLRCEAALGGAVNEEVQLGESGSAVLNMLDGEMLSESGVNMDEEFINLMSAQKAYQACARVLSTASDLLDEIMNLAR